MSVQSSTTNEPHTYCDVDYSNKDLIQHSLNQHEFTLIQMPDDVINVIMHKVSDYPSVLKSAMRAVEFGRVSARIHLLTHEDADTHALIHNEKKFDVLTEFLEEKLKEGKVEESDPYEMRYVFRDKDVKTAESHFQDFIEDLTKNHPGLDDKQYEDVI